MWGKITHHCFVSVFDLFQRLSDLLCTASLCTRAWLLVSESSRRQNHGGQCCWFTSGGVPSASSVLTKSKEGKGLVISQAPLGTQTASWEREKSAACYHWSFSSDLAPWGQKGRWKWTSCGWKQINKQTDTQINAVAPGEIICMLFIFLSTAMFSLCIHRSPMTVPSVYGDYTLSTIPYNSPAPIPVFSSLTSF